MFISTVDGVRLPNKLVFIIQSSAQRETRTSDSKPNKLSDL
jgi:hypothetical protein